MVYRHLCVVAIQIVHAFEGDKKRRTFNRTVLIHGQNACLSQHLRFASRIQEIFSHFVNQTPDIHLKRE